MIKSLSFFQYQINEVVKSKLRETKNNKKAIHKPEFAKLRRKFSNKKKIKPEITMTFLSNLFFITPINTPSSQKDTAPKMNIKYSQNEK